MLETISAANKLYAKYTVSEGDAIDNTAVNVIKNDCPPFLLPLRLMEFDGEIQLRYEISGGVALGYQNFSMNKESADRLLFHMLEPFETCADWFLDGHSICLDENYIVVGRDFETVKYIYLPTAQYRNDDKDMLDFFCNLITKMRIQNDTGYAFELLQSILTERSLHALFERINLSVNGVHKTGNAVLSEPAPAPQPKPQHEPTPVPQPKPQPDPKEEPEDDGFDDLFGKKGSGRLFGIFGGKKKEKEKKADKDKASGRNAAEKNAAQEGAQASGQGHFYAVNTGMPDNSDATVFDTEVPTEAGQEGMVRLRLKSSGGFFVPEDITLDVTLGRCVVGRTNKNGQNEADYCFDQSITRIGRRHFCIERQKDTYFIVDLEAKNHTYLNDVMLLPNQRCALKNGDVIGMLDANRICYEILLP